MKKIICIIMIACMASCLGCNRQTVTDAENIDKSRAESISKNKNDAPTTATKVGLEQTVWVAGKSADISEAAEGQLISGGGYELTVLESYNLGSTIAKLDSITGNSEFKNNIIKLNQSYNGEGEYTGRQKNACHIAIKVRIKCTYIENARRQDNVVCFSPNLYNKSSGSAYNMITGTEGVAYDKYTGNGKDGLLYTFEEGEEIETWMVVRYSAALSSNDDIYMYSGFVNPYSLGDGFNNVKDGAYMIKLNLNTK